MSSRPSIISMTNTNAPSPRACTQTVIDSGENAPRCMHANVENLWLVITSTRLAKKSRLTNSELEGMGGRGDRRWKYPGNITLNVKDRWKWGWLRLSGEWKSKTSVNELQNWGSSPAWIDGTSLMKITMKRKWWNTRFCWKFKKKWRALRWNVSSSVLSTSGEGRLQN